MILRDREMLENHRRAEAQVAARASNAAEQSPFPLKEKESCDSECST